MLFTPDTEDSLTFAVALMNTDAAASRSADDELRTPAQLTGLLEAHSYSGRFDRDEAELADVVSARAQLRDLWTRSRDDAVPEVNRMLADAAALPRLVRHDGFDWHLHATDVRAPLAERIRVEVALALVDVIRSDEWGRLRPCAAPDCAGVLIDVSRNGSKRFCSVRCGNRVNMVAFRARGAGGD